MVNKLPTLLCLRRACWVLKRDERSSPVLGRSNSLSSVVQLLVCMQRFVRCCAPGRAHSVNIFSFPSLLLGLGLLETTIAAKPALAPVDLRCEYLKNPLGIDALQPRLNWRLESGKRGARGQSQTAYQVLVAASESTLRHDQGDLWDSGKMFSDQSLHIAYAGKPLRSGQSCWWKVRVWDEVGSVSPWSETASWSMGLLSPADWEAA